MAKLLTALFIAFFGLVGEVCADQVVCTNNGWSCQVVPDGSVPDGVSVTVQAPVRYVQPAQMYLPAGTTAVFDGTHPFPTFTQDVPQVTGLALIVPAPQIYRNFNPLPPPRPCRHCGW